MKILIVGGGYIASQKLGHLLDFTNNIKLIAPDFSDLTMDLIDKNSLEFEKREYIVGDIENFGVVIIAVDSIKIQEEIFKESRQYRCLCNAVDSIKYCDFIFPSYIKKDNLTIAISTSGSSPAFARHLRLFLEKIIPNSVGDFLKQMSEYRKTMKKGNDRMKFLDSKAKEYIDKWKVV